MALFSDIRPALLGLRSLSAAELLQKSGVHASQLSRMLRQPLPELLRFGAGKSTRYALTREIPGIGRSLALFRVDEQGRPAVAAHAHFLQDEGTLIAWADRRLTEHSSIPWFIEDMRPQGFLGRMFVRAHPELGLGAPDTWRVDDIWRVLSLHGEDLGGDLLVGERTVERFAARQLSVIASEDRVEHYARQADAVMAGGMPASSAGGEHPKLTASVTGGGGTATQVIVKFSPPRETPEGQRWSDLLVCEHLALEALAQAGVAASRSEIILGAARTFLEVERFDRVGAAGRRAVVSLRMIDAEFNSQSAPNWAVAARSLVAKRHLSAADAATVSFLEAFGRLIANSDRHFGNLSFFWRGGLSFSLAPVYDMLPMAFAPTSQGMADTLAAAPHYDAVTLEQWPRAVALAEVFWRCVAADPMISKEFKQKIAHTASGVREMFAL